MSLLERLSLEDGIKRDTFDAWGQTYPLRSLSGDEMIDYANGDDKPENTRVAGVRLLVATLEDEDGARVPDEDRTALIAQLLKKDFKTLQLFVRAARALNGLTLGGPKVAQEAIKND